ncbi:MAG: Na+/H+ antiporter subunit E [Phaeovulum sp.]|uniref:Na+/H+ antiporter subunit E n=1 Tax=Phaeovulum sp. TaxID=2934796 RepID=UPI0027365C71|nr:Na+/H+ antiporter subunit E [Phaeovulum sp.]MDP3860775.1 Na+/H+ antiporter subunit E [Phaeovulum sp.]
MMRKLFPHPQLTILLALVWLLLVNHLSAGSLVMALILGTAVPLLTAPYWPERPRLHNLPMIGTYVAIVLHDIVVANFTVARIVLAMPNTRLRPAWIAVPLRLTQPEAITVLAATITLTPGTVSSDLSADGRSLLVHCLHAPDPEAVVRAIQTRYEARLLEIFA